jgi:ATP-dependent DNA helicase RecG
MDAEDIIRILRQGEGPHIEFKSDFPKQVDGIAKEMAALANSGGGVLVMGVADDGTLPGILDPDKVAERLAGIARFLPVSPEIDKFQLSKKLFIVYARIHPCAPCFYRDRIYHRVGSSSEPCTSREQLNKILSSHTLPT